MTGKLKAAVLLGSVLWPLGLFPEPQPQFIYCPRSARGAAVQGILLENREGRWYRWKDRKSPLNLAEACPRDPVDDQGQSLASFRTDYNNRSFEERKAIPLSDCTYAEGYIVGQAGTDIILVRNPGDESGLRISDNEDACRTGSCRVRLRDPLSSGCMRKAYVPGYAQWMRGDTVKSSITIGVMAGLLAATVGAYQDRQSLAAQKESLLLKNYLLAYEVPRPYVPNGLSLPLGITLFSSELGGLQRQYDNLSRRLGACSVGLILVYGWNIYDGRTGPHGIGSLIPVPPSPVGGPSVPDGRASTFLGFALRF